MRPTTPRKGSEFGFSAPPSVQQTPAVQPVLGTTPQRSSRGRNASRDRHSPHRTQSQRPRDSDRSRTPLVRHASSSARVSRQPDLRRTRLDTSIDEDSRSVKQLVLRPPDPQSGVRPSSYLHDHFLRHSGNQGDQPVLPQTDGNYYRARAAVEACRLPNGRRDKFGERGSVATSTTAMRDPEIANHSYWGDPAKREPYRTSLGTQGWVQDFTEEVLTYEKMVAAYTQFGYQLVEVPKLSVEERVEFILASIDAGE